MGANPAGRHVVRLGVIGYLARLGRRLWRLRAPLAVAGALGLYAVVLPTAWLYASSGRYRASADRVPAAPVGVVFGAGAQNGRPTPMLAKRLDLALRLYRSGKVKVLLVSGDNSRKDYDEPTVMSEYLVGRGMPRGKIVLDYAGFDTWDSCVRAKRIFGVDRAILVTQDFHLPRTVALCRIAGIDAWGVGDDSWSYARSATATLYGREIPAAFKAAYDALFTPQPYFLGRRETGIQRALGN